MTSTAATGADAQPPAATRHVVVAVAAVAATVLLLGGCAPQRPARPEAGRAISVQRPARPPSRRPDREQRARLAPCSDEPCEFGDGTRVTGWGCFRGTIATLRKEIARRDAELKSGPIGNRARELGSLRLALAGYDLVYSGAWDAARDTVARAIDLDRQNGYAWLLSAELHERISSRTPALAALGEADRHLPAEPLVRCELEGLRSSIRTDVPKP